MFVFRKLLNYRLKFWTLKPRDRVVFGTSLFLILLTLFVVLREEINLNRRNVDSTEHQNVVNNNPQSQFVKRHLQKTPNASKENFARANLIGKPGQAKSQDRGNKNREDLDHTADQGADHEPQDENGAIETVPDLDDGIGDSLRLRKQGRLL